VMTPLVVSLKGPGVKMSASIPESSIKVYESENSIREKVRNAYCPAGVIQDNPVLQLAKYIIFPVRNTLKIERDKKYGGDLSYEDYQSLERDFVSQNLHPLDLKTAVSSELVKTFTKVRKFFEKNNEQLQELGQSFVV